MRAAPIYALTILHFLRRDVPKLVQLNRPAQGGHPGRVEGVFLTIHMFRTFALMRRFERNQSGRAQKNYFWRCRAGIGTPAP
jgi:hypothetical protein